MTDVQGNTPAQPDGRSETAEADRLSSMTQEERAAYRARRARRAAREAAREKEREAQRKAPDSIAHLVTVASERFRERDWDGLSELGSKRILQNKDLKKLLLIAGRGAIYRGSLPNATRLLTAANALSPGDPEIEFYHGVVELRMGKIDAAIATFRTLRDRSWSLGRVRNELIAALVAKIKASPPAEELFLELLAEISASLENGEISIGSDVALLLQSRGHGDEALDLIEHLLLQKPDRRRSFEDKARILVEQGRIAEAVELSHHILKRWPDSGLADFNVRVLGTIDSDVAPKRERYAIVTRHSRGNRIITLGGNKDNQSEEVVSIPVGLNTLDADWLVVGAATNPSIAKLRSLTKGAMGLGYVQIDEGADLWRREAIIDLFESDLIPSLSPSGSLKNYRSAYGRRPAPSPIQGTAIIMSRHGSVKFGGGEHFIESMARHYERLGYSPLILGCRPELIGKTGKVGGYDYVHVENNPGALRRAFFSYNATLVHSLSSIGYNAARALRFTNIPFVYGIHFWSDALGHGTGDKYFEDDGEPIPRKEFSYIVARAHTVYCNSEYSQRIIEKAHGMRCPVIFSVPEEAL